MAQRQKDYDSDPDQLASMRAFLREACLEIWQAEPTDETLLQHLALAVTEAASNIMLHGDQDQRREPITLIVDVNDEQVRVTLRHLGKPFDPRTAPEPLFDGSRESGFGLYLIRQCVDDVAYDQDSQGRCLVHLVKKRRHPHKGEDHAAQG